MKKQSPIYFLILSFLFGMTACVQSHVQQRPYSDTHFKKPSLESLLDRLYESNRAQWKNKVKHYIISASSQLPERHLLLAIKSFNTLKQRDICLKAAYLFLNNQATVHGQLTGDNRQLFSKLVEYTLRNPASFDLNQLHYICGSIQDDICYQLK